MMIIDGLEGGKGHDASGQGIARYLPFSVQPLKGTSSSGNPKQLSHLHGHTV